MASEVFKVRRTVGKSAVFFAVFGLFIPAGVVVWVWADPVAGVAIAGFGAVCVLLMTLQIAAFGSWYRIGAEGLTLKRGRKQLLMAPGLLAGARVVGQDEADSILRSFTGPIMASERAMDLKGWLRSNRAYGEFTRFCTVPIVQEKTSAGHENDIVSFNAHTTGDFVIVKDMNGRHLLLSPEYPREFMKALSAVARLSDPVAKPKDGWGGAVTSDDIARRQKGRRFYTVYAVISTVIALGIAGYVLRDTIFPPPEPYTEIPVPETGWVGTDVFRVVITTPPVAADFYSEVEARKQQITRNFDRDYPYDVTEALMEWHYQDTGIYPTGRQREAVHSAVMAVVPNLEAGLLKADFNDEMTSLTAWIEVRGDNLQGAIRGVIDGALADD